MSLGIPESANSPYSLSRELLFHDRARAHTFRPKHRFHKIAITKNPFTLAGC
jgi:hypothetical protein